VTTRPSVLVITTVHHPDDTRIREKTIRSLATQFSVAFAARMPGPSDQTAIEWIPLIGDRKSRNRQAWRLAFARRDDIVSLHDPELLPLGLALSWFGKRKVVFDLHEDVPAQISTKAWVPFLFRPVLALGASVLLKLAERRLTITLAEDSYAARFRRPHEVIANFPVADGLPFASDHPSGEVVYVGDVTEERGLIEAVAACAAVDVPLRVVGGVSGAFESALHDAIVRSGAVVELVGRQPHRLAMQALGNASVAISPLRDLPNYRHSIPTKIVEYLAVGIPVVASDLPATRALVEGLEAVSLVPPGDSAALADGIRRCLAPGVRSAARRQAMVVRERFTWPGERLVAIYLDLVV
jgi:glycosyltransferase involved in cell wall biosynthesis